ncbi:MAG: hypothetical protein PHP82_04115 [Candidatus ainarchaeum sp.]|nr:hypothetical protein [Candidatus ainarchaeum sp.]
MAIRQRGLQNKMFDRRKTQNMQQQTSSLNVSMKSNAKMIFSRMTKFRKNVSVSKVGGKFNELVLDKIRRKQKTKEIYEKLLRKVGLKARNIGRDKRFYAIAESLVRIYEGKLVELDARLEQINNILSKELAVNSPLLEQSPTLKTEIEKMKFGKIDERGQQVLTQAINDILKKNQIL